MFGVLLSRYRMLCIGCVVLSLMVVTPTVAFAQEPAAIEGRVTDAASGRPVVTALVTAVNEEGLQVGSAMTGSEGRYRMTVPPGNLEMVASALGYGTQRIQTISVSESQSVDASFSIVQQAFELAPLVVSVGRTYERAMGAPAHVEIVSEAEIRARPTTTPVDHLRSVPGVDVITQGVQSTNVVVRGFNNIFSGALHTLTDHRIAGVPSLRVNVMSFIPTSSDDIERMEVVLGPGAALYGPNTSDGVLHLITKSPLGESGSSVSVMGGNQSLFGGNFRTSQRVSDRLGVKVSGQFMRAKEWEYLDPTEIAERQKYLSNPDFWRADLMRAVGIDAEEADRRFSRVAMRNFDIERWSGEFRADFAITEEATAIFTAGTSTAGNQIELTGLGAGQVQDWRYHFYQARLNWNRLFAQAYLNQSNAGETFLLRNGAPIVDRSRLWVTQLQHGTTVGSRQSLTYGIDFFYTNPETEGTINGIYEDEDDTREIGVYLQSETRLTPKLNLVLAGRIDDHSALPDQIFSPRAALVFEPFEGQVFRATYNRAFSTPSSLNQFLDLGTAMPAAQSEASLLGYSLRVQGTGTAGFQFRQPDGSYLMRSPFLPDPTQLVPAGAAANLWPAAVGVVVAQAQAAGQPVPQPIQQRLGALMPTPGDISAGYFNTVTGQSGSISALDLPDLSPMRESTQTTFEIGYKGLLAGRTLLAADVWHSRRHNLVTPLTVQTPFVTMNGQEVGAFVVPELIPEFMALGMTPEEAQERAVELATGLASVPVGVISSPGVNASGAQLLMTFTNVDQEIDLWGVDLAATHLLGDEWSLSASASFVSDHHFVSDEGLRVVLNAAKEKGSLAVNYRSPERGITAEVRARFAGEYPADSGVYSGLACLSDAPAGADPCVDSITFLDMNASYRIPMLPDATVQLAVQNILNERYRSFPGVPEVGRMALLQLRYAF